MLITIKKVCRGAMKASIIIEDAKIEGGVRDDVEKLNNMTYITTVTVLENKPCSD